jgi:hypothetical protein
LQCLLCKWFLVQQWLIWLFTQGDHFLWRLILGFCNGTDSLIPFSKKNSCSVVCVHSGPEGLVDIFFLIQDNRVLSLLSGCPMCLQGVWCNWLFVQWSESIRVFGFGGSDLQYKGIVYFPCKAQFRDLNLSKSLISLQAISCPATAIYCRSLVRLLSTKSGFSCVMVLGWVLKTWTALTLHERLVRSA